LVQAGAVMQVSLSNLSDTYENQITAINGGLDAIALFTNATDPTDIITIPFTAQLHTLDYGTISYIPTPDVPGVFYYSVTFLAKPIGDTTLTGSFTILNPSHNVSATLRSGETVVATRTIPITATNAVNPASFTFDNVTPGTYSLIFSQPGHTTFTIHNIVIPDGGTVNLSDDPRFPDMLPLHPGDVNGDGQVNISDLNVLLNNWMGSYENANFSGSGQVNIVDLNLMLQNWMATSVIVE